MRIGFLDNSLNWAVIFLLGLCVGVSIVGDSLSITTITGIVLSTTAIFGITTWKHQIDYKERKYDRKALTKTIKLLNANISESMKEIAYPIEKISEIDFVEINTSNIKRKTYIRDLHQSISQCIELKSKIESEIVTNVIIQNSKPIQDSIQNLIIKSDLLIGILYESKMLLNEKLQDSILETRIFKEKNKRIDKLYKSYFKQYIQVEMKLGIFHHTLKNHQIARQLGLL